MVEKQLWNEILEQFNQSERKIEIVEGNANQGKQLLDEMGLTMNSTIGNIIYNSSAIIVDHWIRVFGQGNEKCNSIIEENKKTMFEGMFFVANDVVGGLFAMDQQGIASDIGTIWYFAPDTLQWENLQLQYSEFISWLSHGNVNEFYESMRWSGWEQLVQQVDYKSGILIYPYLWSNEVQIETATKKIVPYVEIVNLNMECYDKFENEEKIEE